MDFALIVLGIIIFCVIATFVMIGYGFAIIKMEKSVTKNPLKFNLIFCSLGIINSLFVVASSQNRPWVLGAQLIFAISYALMLCNALKKFKKMAKSSNKVSDEDISA